MHFCDFQKNFKSQQGQEIVKINFIFKKKSYHLRILVVKNAKKNSWLINSTTNLHVYNNQRLISKYTKKPRRVKRFIADKISFDRKKIKIRLAKKNGSKNLILTLINVFYLPNSQLNLVSLNLFNNAGIYHYNEN